MSKRFSGFYLRLLVALLGALNLAAQGPKPTEYQVKAVYLYNFAKFIEWPTQGNGSRRGTFTVCVLGQDLFGPALEAALAGETVDGAPAAAKRIARPQDAADCRVLFVSASEDGRWKEILAVLDRDKLSVLTVSDMPQFARRGGMVQFLLDGNRVRFEVNLAAAEHAGLNLSSQLLKLAVNVRRSP